MCGDCRGSLGRPSEKGCYAIMSKISEDKYCICSAFLLLPLGLEWLFFFFNVRLKFYFKETFHRLD